MYSFQEYSADIEHTRQGVHNTVAYNCLGLIGEMGELVDIIMQLLPEHENEHDLAVMGALYEFLDFSARVEQLKKRIRKAQLRSMPIENVPQGGETNEKLIEELGGVLWYLDTLANNLKINLGEAARENQEMLTRRFNNNPNWMTKGEKTH